MPDYDSAAPRAATLRPMVCASTGGGPDAASVHVTGVLDVERRSLLQGRPAEAAAGQLDLLEPSAQLSLRFAPEVLIP